MWKITITNTYTAYPLESLKIHGTPKKYSTVDTHIHTYLLGMNMLCITLLSPKLWHPFFASHVQALAIHVRLSLKYAASGSYVVLGLG